jgi:hypothetical protein
MGLVISVEPSHHPGSPVGSCKAIMKRYYYRLFHVTVHTSAKERTIWIQSNAGEPDSTNPSPPPSPIREIEQHRTMILTIMHNSTDVLWIQGFKLRPAVKDQGNPDAASGCRHAHLDLMLGPLCCPMTHWTAVFLHGLWNQGLERTVVNSRPPLWPAETQACDTPSRLSWTSRRKQARSRLDSKQNKAIRFQLLDENN